MREDSGIKAFLKQLTYVEMSLLSALPEQLKPCHIYGIANESTGETDWYLTDEAGGISEMHTSKDALQANDWQPIETVPAFQYVEVYSAEFAKLQGGGSLTNGITLCLYRPPTSRLPGEFIEQTGLIMKWPFTHWRYIRPNPDQTELLPEPPLTGHWHHGNGILVSGGVRIARADFDTNPSDEFAKPIFDWICQTLNKAIDVWYATRSNNESH